jgi:hypothetical protein
MSQLTYEETWGAWIGYWNYWTHTILDYNSQSSAIAISCSLSAVQAIAVPEAMQHGD